MPKRKNRTAGRRAVATLMLVSLAGVAAFAAYVHFTPQAQKVAPDLHRPVDNASDQDSEPAPIHHARRRHTEPDVTIDTTPESGDLRIPVVSGMNVKLGKSAGPVPDGTDPMVFMASATMKALEIEKVRAIGVQKKGRNALIDFNSELEGGMGTNEESTIIKAMQTAMGQFPDIDTFQFVVDGKVLNTLGEIDLSDPIPVIRDGKEVKTSTTPSSDQNPPEPN